MFGCSSTKHLLMPLPSWSCVESRLSRALEVLWLDWASTEPGGPAWVWSNHTILVGAEELLLWLCPATGGST